MTRSEEVGGGKIDRYDQNKRDTTMHNKIFYGIMCDEVVSEQST